MKCLLILCEFAKKNSDSDVWPNHPSSQVKGAEAATVCMKI